MKIQINELIQLYYEKKLNGEKMAFSTCRYDLLVTGWCGYMLGESALYTLQQAYL